MYPTVGAFGVAYAQRLRRSPDRVSPDIQFRNIDDRNLPNMGFHNTTIAIRTTSNSVTRRSRFGNDRQNTMVVGIGRSANMEFGDDR